MMSPESEEVRTRVRFAACGFAVAALAALGALGALGLNREGPKDIVIAPPPRAATTANGAVSRAQAQRTADRRSSAISAEMPKGQLFAPSSVWNQRLPINPPLDSESNLLIAGLVAEVERERAAAIGPWIGTSAGSTPLYRVASSQPPVRVRLSRGNEHGRRTLQRAFSSVPIPRDAKPAPGLDGHLTVWQPSTDKLWELFHATHRNDGWHADWGGAIRNVSENRGYYTRSAWPGAARNWGATASSLPIVGGTILLDDIRKGRISHALAINLPAPRAGVFAWPAQRTDGTGPPTALPEGARLRLDPSVNVAELGLPKLGRMIALAAQRYGIVVRDQTHHGISFFGEVPSQKSARTYRKLFDGRTPGQILTNFPWDRLQVLAMHLCTTAPCDER
jgi:hypothetical protein